MSGANGGGDRRGVTTALPGDLAVWDRHAAMVVSNGMMIEAGDSVGLSPIRTTNAGQGFQGFLPPDRLSGTRRQVMDSASAMCPSYPSEITIAR